MNFKLIKPLLKFKISGSSDVWLLNKLWTKSSFWNLYMTKTHEKCPKNRNFSEIFFLQFFGIKMFFWSKFLSPMCLNSWDFLKKPKKRRKSRKMAVKSVNIQILKNGFHYIWTWSNLCLNSKFQAALMFDGWGNREQTHNFGNCIWQKHTKNGLKIGIKKK